MTGGAKAESPPVVVLLDLNGAVDPLSACPKAGAGNIVVAQEKLPYHVVGAGWSTLSVVSDDGDGFEGVEREVFIVPVRTRSAPEFHLVGARMRAPKQTRLGSVHLPGDARRTHVRRSRHLPFYDPRVEGRQVTRV
ncbi:hypothetical protein CDL15_Pgr017636 [Punica granatum]|uniref:Uncharacterized protein n=1 Tax=Punica granatum TaxID=22663 RepID=A0A218XW16_PUNGR|nr:hypothetical protein CDL15_Pgr017636 [Punica granatum]